MKKKKIVVITSVVAVVLIVTLALSLGLTLGLKSNPLGTPNNLRADGNTIRWDEVQNAESYELLVNELTYTLTECRFNFDEYNFLSGDYKIKVKAKSGNKKFADSDYSAEFTFTYVNSAMYTLNILTSDGGTASITNASSSYAPNSVIEVIARPERGWFFDGWYSNNYFKLSSNETFSFTINTNTVLRAQFSQKSASDEYTNYEETELIGSSDNFALYVHCPEGVDYIRNNLFIYDDYYLDDNNEVIPEYSQSAIKPIGEIYYRGNNYYVVYPQTGYDASGAYVAKATGSVTILKEATKLGNSAQASDDAFISSDEEGLDELTFTIANTEHTDLKLRDNVRIFSYRDNANASSGNVDGWVIERIGTGLSSVRDLSGNRSLYEGFITDSISINRYGSGTELQIGDIVGFGGGITRNITVDQINEYTVFGEVYSIEILGEELYPVYFVVLIPVEDENEVFSAFDIYKEEEVPLEEAVDPEDPALIASIEKSFYENDEFLNFLAGVKNASDIYATENGAEMAYSSAESFLDKIKIKPSVKIEGSKFILKITGNIPLEFSKSDPSIGKVKGKIEISFEFSETVEFKVQFAWIKNRLRMKRGFDVSLVSKEDTKFAFDVKITFSAITETSKPNEPDNSNYRFLVNKRSGCIHLPECWHIKQMLETNKLPSNDSLASLESQGYWPCKTCMKRDKDFYEDHIESQKYKDTLTNSLAYKDWGDSLKQIKQSLKGNSSTSSGEADKNILLGQVTFNYIVNFNLRLYLHMSFSLEASIHYEHVIATTTQIGIRATVNSIKPYSNRKSYTKSQELTLIGKVGVKVGLKLDFSVGDPFGCIEAGIYGELGVYADLSGIAHVSEDEDGLAAAYAAAYFELGLYYDVGVRYKAIWGLIKGSKSIVNGKEALLKMGHDKAIYGYVYDIDEMLLPISESKTSVDLSSLKLWDVKNIKLPDMKEGTEVLNINSDQYTVNLTLEGSEWLRLYDNKIMVVSGAPYNEVFEATLTVNVVSKNKQWTDYVKDRPSLYLPTREIKLIAEVECKNHNYKYFSKLESTCTEKGFEEHQICTKCFTYFNMDNSVIDGKPMIDELGHDYKILPAVEATCYLTGLTEGSRCERCGDYEVHQQETPALGHDLTSNNWEVIKAAGCTTQGQAGNKCSRCEFVFEYRVILPTGHRVDPDYKVPVCGEGPVLCEDCHVVLAAPIEHNYIEISHIDATCSTDGESRLQCMNCSHVETVVLEKGHKIRQLISESAYCDRDGEKIYICDVCEETVTEVIPAGHDFSSEWTIDIEPTCSTEGSRSHRCIRCDAQDETSIEIVPVAQHIGSKDDPGHCKYCGIALNVVHTDDHPTRITGYVSATCLEDGKEAGEFCDICNGFIENGMYVGDKQTIIPRRPDDHSLVKNDKVDPTCISDGSVEHWECDVCHRIFEDEHGNVELQPDDIVLHSNPYLQECHNWEEIPAVQCQDGIPGHVVYQKCTLCENGYYDIFSREVILEDGMPAKFAHTLTRTHEAGSCTEWGSITYECRTTDSHYGCGTHTVVFDDARLQEIWTSNDKNLVKLKNDYIEEFADNNILQFYNHFVPSGVVGYTCRTCEATLGLSYEQQGENYVVTGYSVSGSEPRRLIVPDTYLGKKVVGIKSNAFAGCTNITYVKLGINIESIGASAFEGCLSLTSVIIGKNVVTLGDNAFKDCTKLSTLAGGENVAQIGASAFENCVALNEIKGRDEANASGVVSENQSKLGDNITNIGDRAFYDCRSLTTVNLPQVRSIGSYAFGNCLKLSTIAFNGTVGQWYEVTKDENWDSEAGNFDANSIYAVVCKEGTLEIHIIGNVKNAYEVRNGAIYQAKGQLLSKYENTNFTGKYIIEIPETINGVSISSIGSGSASIRCINLYAMTLPNTVTNIKNFAFQNAGSLTAIKFPESLQSIGNNAFENARMLMFVDLPQNLNNLGEYCFKNCSTLAEISIPQNVIRIGNAALSGCENLKSMVIPFVGGSADLVVGSAANPKNNSTALFGYIFGSTSYPGGIQVSQRYGSSSSNNQSYTLNKTYYIPSTLNTVTVMKGNIPYGAFSNCTMLEKIVLESEVCVLWHYAFENCSSLKTVGVYGAVTVYYKDVFNSCSNLSEVEIRDVASWLNCIWNENENTMIETRHNPLYYAHNLYMEGQPLTNIVIPNSVTKIPWAAFDCGMYIRSVYIPKSVTSIDYYAFSQCSNLSVIMYEGTINEWNQINKETGFNCGWNYNTGEYTIYCLDGKISKSGTTEVSPLQLQYNNEGTGYIVTGTSNKNDSAYVVPSRHNGLPVVEIGNNAFSNCSNMSYIYLPDSITQIGDNAFIACRNLVNLVLPENLINIGDGAFAGCSALTNIYIPNSVSYIGKSAFSDCTKLENITIPNGITSINNSTFQNCRGLISVTLPKDGITSIGSMAFSYCKMLTNITIPSSVTCIGEHAFAGCSALTNVIVPVGVTVIDSYAFQDCSGLTNISIADSVTSIGNYVFSGCTKLSKITIPNEVTSISDGTFQNCSELTSVTLPSYVMNIGSRAFSNCKMLTSILIPCSVTNIGSEAFSGCSRLENITIPNEVMSIANRAFYNCSSITSVTIPDSVTRIGTNAFSGCNNLEEVHISNLTKWCGISFGDSDSNPLKYAHNLYVNQKLVTDLNIPNDITEISAYAFSGCSSIMSLVIQDNIKNIGRDAFTSCDNLVSAFIPTNVIGHIPKTTIQNIGITSGESIDYIALRGFSVLTNITIGSSITNIAIPVFDGCGALSYITVDKDNPKYHSENNCLIETESKTLIAGCKNSIIPDDGSVTSISAGAFYGCSGLKNIVIPDNITYIGGFAFRDCIGLSSINVPSSVLTIDLAAFSGCGGLTRITVDKENPHYKSVGNCLIEIGSKTLIAGCQNSIIPDDGSVTSIASGAFLGCSGLTSIVIPDGVTSIDEAAFCACVKLTSVVIHEGMLNIGKQAFCYCSELTSIVISKSVKDIGSSAFEECEKLTSVFYNGTATEWVNLKVEDWNTPLTDATVYYYSEEQPVEEGNYWHYVDGVVSVW